MSLTFCASFCFLFDSGEGEMILLLGVIFPISSGSSGVSKPHDFLLFLWISALYLLSSFLSYSLSVLQIIYSKKIVPSSFLYNSTSIASVDCTGGGGNLIPILLGISVTLSFGFGLAMPAAFDMTLQ